MGFARQAAWKGRRRSGRGPVGQNRP